MTGARSTRLATGEPPSVYEQYVMEAVSRRLRLRDTASAILKKKLVITAPGPKCYPVSWAIQWQKDSRMGTATWREAHGPITASNLFTFACVAFLPAQEWKGT